MGIELNNYILNNFKTKSIISYVIKKLIPRFINITNNISTIPLKV